MKQGYFISERDFALLATITEMLLEEERLAGELLTPIVERVRDEPTTVDDMAERDAYWDKVCEQHDRDRLANEPSMEGWDAKWAADVVANKLTGGV